MSSRTSSPESGVLASEEGSIYGHSQMQIPALACIRPLAQRAYGSARDASEKSELDASCQPAFVYSSPNQSTPIWRMNPTWS